MTRYKCKTCGGEYDDIEPDGMAYYHACPPKCKAKDAQGNCVLWEEDKDKRDENIDDSDPLKAKMRKEGKGRSVVA